jgi:hypothetical protein
MLFIWAYPFCLDGEGQAKKVAHSALQGNCCIRLRGILHQQVIIFNSNIAILRVVFYTKNVGELHQLFRCMHRKYAR